MVLAVLVQVTVKLRPGFSQLDWVKLTRAAKDLAGLRGAAPRAMTINEVKSISKSKEGACAGRRSPSSKGVVYNVRQYLPYHLR